MQALASLVQWLVTYSVTGGFWHFVACYLIVLAITRIFRFVKIDLERKAKPAKTSSEEA